MQLTILNQHASTALFANLDINSYFIATMQKGHYLTYNASCLCLLPTNCFNIAYCMPIVMLICLISDLCRLKALHSLCCTGVPVN